MDGGSKESTPLAAQPVLKLARTRKLAAVRAHQARASAAPSAQNTDAQIGMPDPLPHGINTRTSMFDMFKPSILIHPTVHLYGNGKESGEGGYNQPTNQAVSQSTRPYPYHCGAGRAELWVTTRMRPPGGVAAAA